MNIELNKGDYVLATKYSDGDPYDHWAVGWYDRKKDDGRHLVVDADGRQYRAGGFRKVRKIPHEQGVFILENKEELTLSHRSIWWWSRGYRKLV